MKSSGSISSLMQGVSQQVPQDRNPGQHTSQVNMISDPVQGLSRRHGSKFVAEAVMAGHPPENLADYIADTDNWRTFTYTNNNNDYVILYRTGTRVSNLPPVIVFNRTTGEYLDVERPVTDTVLDSFQDGGASAICSIGSYVFMAGNTITPTMSTTNSWGDATNQANAVVWIRGGAYARTFTVTATKTDNSTVTFSYTTPTSSYPEVLDTTAVSPYAKDPAGGTQADSESAYIPLVGAVYRHELLWADWGPTGLSAVKSSTAMTNTYPVAPANATQYSYDASDPRYVYFHSSNLHATDITISYTHTKTITNPNYTQQVTTMTNAHTSAVTNWIGTSATAIQPANIAESLKLAAIAAGLTGAVRQSSTVIFTNVKGLTVTDGGDGSLIRGVANEVTSIDQVSTVHLVGKVVKVQARNATEAVYLKAVPKDSSVTSGYTEVTWVEGPGVVQTITNALIYGTVNGNTFYMASSATLLSSILALIAHPAYVPSAAGDTSSNATPYFVGKKITYLGVFQDRLVIGSGATLRFSRAGDYLNLFRSTVVTLPADDPFEMLSQGSDDDTLRFSVLYDKDLVVFGDKRQYVVSGRTILAPTSASMPVQSSHANAAQIPPVAVGTVIFYGQVGERASSLHQIQPGAVSETTESYLVSSQVDTYITGNVIELVENDKPTHIFMRTTGDRNSLFCFTYLDKQGQGRVQDAHSRWDFNSELGVIIGMNKTPEGLMVHFLREGVAIGGDPRMFVVCDLCPMTTGLATYPYLDSVRPLGDILEDSGTLHEGTTDPHWVVAFDSSSPYQFIGDEFVNRAALISEFPEATGPQVGALQETEFTPTNPFIRDRNGKAITSGRLTITRWIVGLAQSAGFITETEARQTTTEREFAARIVNDPDNIVGQETITNMIQNVPVGYEIRDFTTKFKGRTWLPFTITSLEWVGQWFNRTERF